GEGSMRGRGRTISPPPICRASSISSIPGACRDSSPSTRWSSIASWGSPRKHSRRSPAPMRTPSSCRTWARRGSRARCARSSCFKIEGRMKGPEYVANVVEKYRRALDAAMEKRPYPLTARDEEELRYSFSRSFSHGFLTGSDHQELVHGLYPGHRGVLVGRVE